MKVNDLLMNINNKDFNLEESLEVKYYIPIMDKKRFALEVISACTDDIDGFIVADRFKMNIYFNMMSIGLYTNLDIETDFDEMVGQYDSLCENDLLNDILSLFANDYSVLCNVLDGLLDELLVQNSIDMQVVKVANKIMSMIDNIGDNLKDLDLKSILPDSANITELINKVNMLN